MITVYVDGGARGNPGPAGYGARIEDENGELLQELHGGLGIATNNVAEYNGLLAALRWAVDHGHRDVRIRGDSELLVKQMRGEYKVKSPTLRELVDEAESLARGLRRVRYTAVRREHNELADRLVNEALDSAP
jgi:ribonuclease HI